MMSLVVVLCSALLITKTYAICLDEYCEESDHEIWSYNGRKNGPSKWGEASWKCDGTSQSPIDIKDNDVKEDSNLKHLQMINYDKSVTKAYISNNAHIAKITLNDDVKRTISINGETYTLLHLEFHWGGRENRGSEHLFNSKAYSMEVHFIHTTGFGDVAVVGILYQEDDKDNKGFEPIFEVLPKIQYKEQKKDPNPQLESPLNLASLLPKLPLPIFRYSGSLTTPNCREGVTWSVAREVQTIGKQQLEELRSLYSVTKDEDKDGCNLLDNFRPVQPLNNREVTASTK